MQCGDDGKKKSLSFGIMFYCLSPALFLLDEALCSAQHGCRQDICMKATQTKMENGESETLQGSRVRLFFGCTRTQKSGTLEVIAISCAVIQMKTHVYTFIPVLNHLRNML